MVTRALRVGEGRKFKAYEKRAEAINRFEPEMELLDDDELRERGRRACASASATASRSTTSCRRPSR